MNKINVQNQDSENEIVAIFSSVLEMILEDQDRIKVETGKRAYLADKRLESKTVNEYIFKLKHHVAYYHVWNKQMFIYLEELINNYFNDYDINEYRNEVYKLVIDKIKEESDGIYRIVKERFSTEREIINALELDYIVLSYQSFLIRNIIDLLSGIDLIKDTLCKYDGKIVSSIGSKVLDYYTYKEMKFSNSIYDGEEGVFILGENLVPR